MFRSSRNYVSELTRNHSRMFPTTSYLHISRRKLSKGQKENISEGKMIITFDMGDFSEGLLTFSGLRIISVHLDKR